MAWLALVFFLTAAAFGLPLQAAVDLLPPQNEAIQFAGIVVACTAALGSYALAVRSGEGRAMTIAMKLPRPRAERGLSGQPAAGSRQPPAVHESEPVEVNQSRADEHARQPRPASTQTATPSTRSPPGSVKLCFHNRPEPLRQSPRPHRKHGPPDQPPQRPDRSPSTAATPPGRRRRASTPSRRPDRRPDRGGGASTGSRRPIGRRLQPGPRAVHGTGVA